jgi:hypothetical protein
VVLTKFVLSVRNVHTKTPVIITSAAADPDSQTAKDSQLLTWKREFELTRDISNNSVPSGI